MVYVVRLSMVHPSLPRAEALAVLEAAGSGFRELRWNGKYLRVECSREAAEVVLKRCAYVKEISEELLSSHNIRDLLRGLDRFMLPRGNLSFAVEAEKPLSRSLEPLLGELVKRLTGWRVDLENPDLLLKLIKVEDLNVLAISLGKASLKRFRLRGPKLRPAVHPSTMRPMLARCMVNLARVRPGDLVLDPFCGVGGILIEAGLMGCRVLGLDVDRELVKGCLRNLRWIGVEPVGLAVGDARRPPFTGFRTFVSDLPYGRSAKTGGLHPMEILEDFLDAVSPLVDRGVYTCIGVAGLRLTGEVFMKRRFKLVEVHRVKEHKSLVREILVLRRI